MKRIDHILGHLKPSASVTANCTASESFRYTVSDAGLTTEQRRLYETNGFVVIKNLLSTYNALSRPLTLLCPIHIICHFSWHLS